MAESWACGAARDLPLDDSDSWSGSDAESAIFAFAGWPDNPDPAKAKRGFLAYDRGADDKKGSYKLPFATVKDGKLVAVKGGVDAAANRLGSTDIPQSVKDAAQGVIDHYQERFKEDTGGTKASPTFAYQTPVVLRAKGGGGDDLLALAKSRALDPDALDEFPPYFFSVHPSTSATDSYWTQMARSSLKNYETDFAEGRAFQDSHRHDEMPLGYSLTGRFVGSQGNGVSRVESDFFIARGVSPQGDATIARLRTGTVRDVSIGFHGGEWICSVCGRDMLTDWDCWHIPGMAYDPNAKDLDFFFAQQTSRAKSPKADKEPVEKVVCTATIENARAAECSGVFDGATPGAVVKAQRMADAGRLPPNAARFVEVRYGIRINGAAPTWAGWSPPDTRANGTATQTRSAKEEPRMDFEEQVRDLLGVGPDADALAAVRALKERSDAGETVLRGIRAHVKALGAPDDADAGAWVRDEVARLRPLADDGSAYRADLIDAALAEGVRALGNGFATETYRGTLAASSLETIKRMRDDWQAIGDRTFPGGRETTDDNANDPIPMEPRRRASKRALAGV